MWFQLSNALDLSPSDLDIVAKMFPLEVFEKILEVDVGWSSRILLLDSKYVVKIPKTIEAGAGIEKEAEITKILESRIPVTIPHYVTFLRNESLKAASYEFLRGVMLTTQPVGESAATIDVRTLLKGENRNSVANQIGALLRSIHSVEPDLVREVLDKYVTDTWEEKILSWLGKCREVARKGFDRSELDKCENLIDNIEHSFSEMEFQKKFIHGDFGGWNMLYDPGENEIVGLLDWADCRIGDPAKDLTELIYDFGEPFAEDVLSHYGKVKDPDMMTRAKLYLRLSGFQDLEYGLSTGNDFFTERGFAAIRKELDSFKKISGSRF